jgi:hypothetical protein
MPRAITESPATQDAYTALGDTVIGHTDEAAQPYRDAAADVRRRQQSGMAPASARVQAAQAPAEAPLPMIGVARQVAGRRIQELKQQAEGIERELQRGCVGAGGNVTEYLVTRQREARSFLADINAEIDRINTLDDDAVRRFAHQAGAR